MRITVFYFHASKPSSAAVPGVMVLDAKYIDQMPSFVAMSLFLMYGYFRNFKTKRHLKSIVITDFKCLYYFNGHNFLPKGKGKAN